jgi:uncharacterized protein
MVMTLGTKREVLQVISSLRQELADRYSVRQIGIFGSTARDDALPGSDVDVIVDMEEPTFDHYMDLKFKLEDILGRPVDLVLADTVKPRLKPLIEQETIHV